MLCAWGACVYFLVGCGSSGATNFFDGASVSSSPDGGNPGMAMNGSKVPCSPAKEVSGGMSGPFGSTGPACLRVEGMIAGWGCSNFDGRTVKVNGREMMCGQLPLPDAVDGSYYFDVSAGTFEYASFYWY